MMPALTQESAYVAFDGGSGAESDALRKQLEAAIDHSQLPTTRRLPSVAAAEAMREAFARAREAPENVRARAIGILNLFSAALAKYDLSRAPPVAAFIDDGALVVEWILRDKRLGLSFEANPQESGWFLVSSPEHGNIRAHGRFDGTELGFLIAWALEQTPRR